MPHQGRRGCHSTQLQSATCGITAGWAGRTEGAAVVALSSGCGPVVRLITTTALAVATLLLLCRTLWAWPSGLQQAMQQLQPWQSQVAHWQGSTSAKRRSTTSAALFSCSLQQPQCIL